MTESYAENLTILILVIVVSAAFYISLILEHDLNDKHEQVMAKLEICTANLGL